MNSEEDVLLGDLMDIGDDLGLEEGVGQPQEVDQVLREGNGFAAVVGQSRVCPVLPEVNAQFKCLKLESTRQNLGHVRPKNCRKTIINRLTLVDIDIGLRGH